MRSRLAAMAPVRRRQLLVVALVAGALVVAAVGWAFVRGLGGDAVADQARPGPVVLVPGYGGDTGDLRPLADRLRERGREVVVYEPTGNETGDLRVQARRLAGLVRDTVERSDAPSVDVVGYSAGGVIARLLVRDEGGAGLVRRVLTLGSPHHGTDVVDTILESTGDCPAACRQLAPDSRLLAGLNAGDETPAGPRWITVRTESDRTVTPASSAALRGALNVVVQRVCPGSTTSHGQLPADPVVAALLDSALGSAAPVPPSGVAC